MSLVKLLQENYYSLINEANNHLHRAHLKHYCSSSDEENTSRISTFLDLVIGSLITKDLTALIQYTEKTAEERYHNGFDLCEVQRALNGLKKAIWLEVVATFEAREHAQHLALIGTIIDETKDMLSCRYVYCTRKENQTRSDSVLT